MKTRKLIVIALLGVAALSGCKKKGEEKKREAINPDDVVFKDYSIVDYLDLEQESLLFDSIQSSLARVSYAEMRQKQIEREFDGYSQEYNLKIGMDIYANEVATMHEESRRNWIINGVRQNEQIDIDAVSAMETYVKEGEEPVNMVWTLAQNDACYRWSNRGVADADAFYTNLLGEMGLGLMGDVGFTEDGTLISINSYRDEAMNARTDCTGEPVVEHETRERQNMVVFEKEGDGYRPVEGYYLETHSTDWNDYDDILVDEPLMVEESRISFAFTYESQKNYEEKDAFLAKAPKEKPVIDSIERFFLRAYPSTTIGDVVTISESSATSVSTYLEDDNRGFHNGNFYSESGVRGGGTLQMALNELFQEGFYFRFGAEVKVASFLPPSAMLLPKRASIRYLSKGYLKISSVDVFEGSLNPEDFGLGGVEKVVQNGRTYYKLDKDIYKGKRLVFDHTIGFNEEAGEFEIAMSNLRVYDRHISLMA